MWNQDLLNTTTWMLQAANLMSTFTSRHLLTIHTNTSSSTTTTTPGLTTASQDLESDSLARRSTWEIVLWSLVLSIILVTAVLGNLLVIACVRTTARLRSEKSNMFLVNLSVTDVGSACVVMTSSLHAMAADQWHLKSVWCDLVCGANYAFIIVSMLTLCFISLDRYAAVVYALRYHAWVTRRKIRLLLAWAWLQGFCFGLAPVLANWVRYDYWEVVCAIVWHEDTTNTLTYVVVAFAVCFLLPGIVLAVAYCKIIKVAKAQNNVHPHTALPPPDITQVRSDIATSAGLTTDHPGISIIGLAEGQRQAVEYSGQGNDQINTIPQHGNTACWGTTGSGSLNHDCDGSEDVEICGSIGVVGIVSGKEATQFAEMERHAEETMVKNTEDLVSHFKNSNPFGKSPLRLKLNENKAGYPEHLAPKHELNGLRKSLSTPVPPSIYQMNLETNVPELRREPGDHTRRALQCKDSRDSQCEPPKIRITKLRTTRPYSAPCHCSMPRDMREMKLSSETLPTSEAQQYKNWVVALETVEAWSEHRDQQLSRKAFAENVQEKGEHLEVMPSSHAQTQVTRSNSLKRLSQSENAQTQVPRSNGVERPSQCLQTQTQMTKSKGVDRPHQCLQRPESSSSCPFSEIPGSPQSLTAPLDTSNGRSGSASSQTPADRNQMKHRNYSTSRKAVKSLLIVVLAFFICMTPFSITKLYKVIFPRPDALPGYVNLVATIFQYCSSVINPLIYGIFRRDFQKAFLLIFNKLLVKIRLRDSINMAADSTLLSY